MTVLTLDRLEFVGACQDQRDLFKMTFGSSVEVTEELCVSVAGLFNWGWAAEKLLSRKDMIEYNVVCYASLIEYEKECVPAEDEYRKVRTDSAWAECVKECAPFKAKYDIVCAAAFGRLYNLGD